MIKIEATKSSFHEAFVPEEIELEAGSDWSLRQAIDMCRRIDRLFGGDGLTEYERNMGYRAEIVGK